MQRNRSFSAVKAALTGFIQHDDSQAWNEPYVLYKNLDPLALQCWSRKSWPRKEYFDLAKFLQSAHSVIQGSFRLSLSLISLFLRYFFLFHIFYQSLFALVSFLAWSYSARSCWLEVRRRQFIRSALQVSRYHDISKDKDKAGAYSHHQDLRTHSPAFWASRSFLAFLMRTEK